MKAALCAGVLSLAAGVLACDATPSSPASSRSRAPDGDELAEQPASVTRRQPGPGGIAATPSADPMVPGNEDQLLPLLRPGRVLHFRGRSSLDASQPAGPLRPSVGNVFSTIRWLGTEPDGRWLLARESFPYSAASRTAAGLSAPSERRRETLRVDPAIFLVERVSTTVEPRRSRDRWGPPAPLVFTSDGFGLNLPARRQIGLHTLTVPRTLFRTLAAGEEITRSFDFFLVIADPRRDRTIVPAAGDRVPPGAERHVAGRMLLRPLGREPFRTDRRFSSPPPVPDRNSPPPVGRPDERVSLPALRIRVEVDLTIEPADGRRGTRRKRQDRLIWTVLDVESEPWMLSWEGLVRTWAGDPSDPDLREASFSQELSRIEDTVQP